MRYVSTDADPSVTSDISTEIDEPSPLLCWATSFEMTFTVGNEGPAPVSDAGTRSIPARRSRARLGAEPRSRCRMQRQRSLRCTVPVEALPTEATSRRATSRPSRSLSRPAQTNEEGGRMANPDAYPIYYGGQGFNCSVGSLAPGDSVDVEASLTRVKSRELWITASTWSSNVDPDYEDNYEEIQLAPDTSHPADLGVDMSGPDDAEIGEEVTYEIEVTNDGPMDARSVIATATLPYGLDYVSSQPSDAADGCRRSTNTSSQNPLVMLPSIGATARSGANWGPSTPARASRWISRRRGTPNSRCPSVLMSRRRATTRTTTTTTTS